MSLRMWRKNGYLVSVEEKKGFFDIAYGDESEAQKLDIFLPEGEGPFPVIISIHGGGFIACDKRQSDMLLPMLEGLNRGFAVVGLNYRLSGETEFPNPVKDIKQAIRFLRANGQAYQLDTDRMVTWGGSAGGYMTLMSCMFAEDSYFDNEKDLNLSVDATVRGGVAWYPLTDFTNLDKDLKLNSMINRDLRKGLPDVSEEYEPVFPQMEDDFFPYHEAEGNVIGKFVGASIKSDLEIVTLASPINHITKTLPPILIQHGSGDEILPMQQSIQFTIKANELLGKERVRLELIPDAIHSSLLFETKENVEKVLDFITEITK